MYLVAQNLSSADKRTAAMEYIFNHSQEVFQYGQARHLPRNLTWNWCFLGGGQVGSSCPAQGTYQNGAYWATPLHYYVAASQNVAANIPGSQFIVESVLNNTMDYFRGRNPGGAWQGTCECVNPAINYHGVDAYVASATNVLQALSLWLDTEDRG